MPTAAQFRVSGLQAFTTSSHAELPVKSISFPAMAPSSSSSAICPLPLHCELLEGWDRGLAQILPLCLPQHQLNIYETLQAGMKQNLDAQFRSREQGYQQPRRVSSSQKSTTQPTTGDDMTKVVSWVRVSPSGMGQTWAVIKVGQNRNKIIQTDLL